MTKELEALEEIIDKFAEQMMRANKEEITATNKTYAIEYLYRTPQVRLLRQALLKAQDDNRFIDLILNKPQLLNVFAFDGIHTWEDFEDTFSDEDKEYINTTKEEFEYMRNQLVKRGKINE